MAHQLTDSMSAGLSLVPTAEHDHERHMAPLMQTDVQAGGLGGSDDDSDADGNYDDDEEEVDDDK